MPTGIDLRSVRLPLLLWDSQSDEIAADLKTVEKYRRISGLSGEILENYAAVAESRTGTGGARAHITAVWSPAGGVGTTSAALAYAAKSASGGANTVYLNLEYFSSATVYFAESGKSISSVFEKLAGNPEILLRGILQKDSASGIAYFCPPSNYDDMNLLDANEVRSLVKAAAALCSELIIDLPSVCDDCVKTVFDLTDKVLCVVDASKSAQTKLHQFMFQHNVFESIRGKTAIVANKGAYFKEQMPVPVVQLPLLHIHAHDPTTVFKGLTSSDFGE
jgi:hypothetical protein